MSIKVLSSIDEAYLSKLSSAKSALASSSGIDASFSDALASAKEMLADEGLNSAEKNAVRAMAVDAAVDAIRQNGGYGLSLDSALAKSLGITAPVGNTGSLASSSSVQVESAESAAARNANAIPVSETHASSSSSDDVFACSDTLEAYFEEASSTYEVDLKLLKCIALVESDFNPDCTSYAGAMGIMQLMPETAEELGVENPYDPYENIMGGAKLISKLLDKYDGDIALAAAAYNAGSGAVAKYGGIPPYEQTQNYVKKVLSYYNS